MSACSMQALYNQAWGWQDLAKRKELAHSGARFLLARDAAGRPHAFAHFRYGTKIPAQRFLSLTILNPQGSHGGTDGGVIGAGAPAANARWSAMPCVFFWLFGLLDIEIGNLC